MRYLISAAGLLAVAFASPVLAGEETVPVEVSKEAASVQIKRGQTVHGANGKRIGKVYRVSPQGDPQVIIGTLLVTVPAATLSEVDGKFTSTLTTRDLTK